MKLITEELREKLHHIMIEINKGVDCAPSFVDEFRNLNKGHMELASILFPDETELQMISEDGY